MLISQNVSKVTRIVWYHTRDTGALNSKAVVGVLTYVRTRDA